MGRPRVRALAAIGAGCALACTVVVEAMPAPSACVLGFALPGDGSCVASDSLCLSQLGGPFQHAWRVNGHSVCPSDASPTGWVFAEPDADAGMRCSQTPVTCAALEAQPRSALVSGAPLLPFPSVSESELADGPEEHARRRRALASTSADAPLRNLVLLLRFSDHRGADLPSAADFDVLFNNAGPDAEVAPTGSVSDVLRHSLGASLHMQHAVVGWVDVDVSEAEAAGAVDADTGLACSGTCARAGLRDAIAQALSTAEADGRLDPRAFDADGDGALDGLTVVHSGHGAEAGGANALRVWSHKWRLSRSWTSADGAVRALSYNVNPGLWGAAGDAISRVGVIAHEMGHFFGLPDLYDTTYASRGAAYYDMMANAWGVDQSQLYPGSMSPWSKAQLGALQPVRLLSPGRYALPPVQASGVVYRLDLTLPGGSSSGSSDEYLLLENRQAVGFDAQLAGGLLVWHVDDALGGSNSHASWPGSADWPEAHYGVRLIQRDGAFHLERNGVSEEPADWFAAGSPPLSDLSTPSLNGYALQKAGLCSGHELADFAQDADGVVTFTYVQRMQDCSGALRESTAGGSQVLSTVPTWYPTRSPTKRTAQPSAKPTEAAPVFTPVPTRTPSAIATPRPSLAPSKKPTTRPTTAEPTPQPTRAPSTPQPTRTEQPTPLQTAAPTTVQPSAAPTAGSQPDPGQAGNGGSTGGSSTGGSSTGGGSTGGGSDGSDSGSASSGGSSSGGLGGLAGLGMPVILAIAGGVGLLVLVLSAVMVRELRRSRRAAATATAAAAGAVAAAQRVPVPVGRNGAFYYASGGSDGRGSGSRFNNMHAVGHAQPQWDDAY